MRNWGTPKRWCHMEMGSLRQFLLPINHSSGRHPALPTSVFPHRSPAALSGHDRCRCVFLKWLSRKTYSNCFIVLWWWREWMGVLEVLLAVLSISVLCVCACSKGSNCLLDGSIYLSVFVTHNKLMFSTGCWNLHLKEGIIKDFFLWLLY